jgi:hypothetical protein
MTAPFRPADLARPAQARRVADDVLTGLPAAIVAAALAWRFGGAGAAAGAMLVAVAVIAVVAVRHAQAFDRGWLIRRLDATRRDLDDSADLLFADAAGLTPLERLQRDRLDRRLAAGTLPDLRPAWSTRRIAVAWALAAVAVAVIVNVPERRPGGLVPSREAIVAPPGVAHLVGQRLRITPPAYTGLHPSDATTLDVRAPQGSTLDWTLAFAPSPAAAALVLPDGSRTPLIRHGDKWTARRTLDRPMLYRVVPQVPAGTPLPPLHRLDAVADAPPTVRVIAPVAGLSLVTPGQRRWGLAFEARDDYGVAAVAQLHLTVAEGEGENVKFREVVVAVRGSGSATVKRFAVAPDLAALKFVAGSDLVAALEVHDNRSPGPQTARSPSLILRWPGSDGDAAGMEGVVTRALPAYFRSERQIIIDAEALIKARPHLGAAAFLAKSDAIGADQRLLRLRYGQFLGEEQEGKAEPPPPTSDAPAAATAATAAAAPPVAEDGTPATPRFGSETNTLADYGHVHDESEAATLIDPATKKLLKGALDAMWQAELNLRQGKPPMALPFAHTALGLIKQVQQATRIFLAKVGPELPAIDETRRLTGKRDGLAPRGLPPVAATAADATPAAVWAALAAPAGADAAKLAALDTWLRANPDVADPLAVAAALDAVRRDPGCGDCRRHLRALLWSALPRPAAGVMPRAAGDAAGRRYLDALGAP